MKRVLSILLLMAFAFTTNTTDRVGKWDFNAGLGHNYNKINRSYVSKEWNLNSALSYKHYSYDNHNGVAGSLFGIYHKVETGSDRILDYKIGEDVGYIFNELFKFYALGLYEVQQSRKLNYRFSVGIGGKYTYIKTSNLDLSISLIPMYVRESYATGLEFKRTVRLSWRSKVIWQPYIEGDALPIGFKSVMFYKPHYNKWSVYILDFNNSFWINISDRFSIELKHIYEVDVNRPFDISERKEQRIIALRISI